MEKILIADKVVKNFGNFKALNEVSISVPKGSIFGLLGPNGAGKTTFIRIINQITMPDEGEVLFDGRKLRPEDSRPTLRVSDARNELWRWISHCIGLFCRRR